MLLNKSEHKIYGFISILSLLLDTTSFELERGVKFFRKSFKQKATKTQVKTTKDLKINRIRNFQSFAFILKQL